MKTKQKKPTKKSTTNKQNLKNETKSKIVTEKGKNKSIEIYFCYPMPDTKNYLHRSTGYYTTEKLVETEEVIMLTDISNPKQADKKMVYYICPENLFKFFDNNFHYEEKDLNNLHKHIDGELKEFHWNPKSFAMKYKSTIEEMAKAYQYLVIEKNSLDYVMKEIYTFTFRMSNLEGAYYLIGLFWKSLNDWLKLSNKWMTNNNRNDLFYFLMRLKEGLKSIGNKRIPDFMMDVDLILRYSRTLGHDEKSKYLESVQKIFDFPGFNDEYKRISEELQNAQLNILTQKNNDGKALSGNLKLGNVDIDKSKNKSTIYHLRFTRNEDILSNDLLIKLWEYLCENKKLKCEYEKFKNVWNEKGKPIIWLSKRYDLLELLLFLIDNRMIEVPKNRYNRKDFHPCIESGNQFYFKKYGVKFKGMRDAKSKLIKKHNYNLLPELKKLFNTTKV